jgi:hypothetical protein
LILREAAVLSRWLRSAPAAACSARQQRNPPVQRRFGGHDLRVLLRRALFAGSASIILLLSGCGSAGKPVADSATPADQSILSPAGGTINYELLDLQKNAAEMQAAGSGQEGAALLVTQRKIQELQNRIQLDSGGVGK